MTSVPRRHRFTVEEYYLVADRGLARGGAKVELIDGAIFDMTPQGPWHVECVRVLAERLIRGIRAGERVYVPGGCMCSGGPGRNRATVRPTSSGRRIGCHPAAFRSTSAHFVLER